MYICISAQSADDNLGKYRHMEQVIFLYICPKTMFFGKYIYKY